MAFGDKKVVEILERENERLRQRVRELEDVLTALKAGPNMLDKLREMRQLDESNDEGEAFTDETVVGEVNGVPVTAAEIRDRFHYWHGGGLNLMQSTKVPE